MKKGRIFSREIQWGGVDVDQSALPLSGSVQDQIDKIENVALRTQLTNFNNTVQQQKKRVGENDKAPQKAEIIQFPLPFPAETRPASNDLIRSSLFAAIRGKDRQHFRNFVQLATIGDIEVSYMGEQLNQDDHDVFMQLIFMAQNSPLGQDVKVPFRRFMAGLGTGYGSNARESASQSIVRLVTGTVRLVNKAAGMDYYGHLVHDGLVPSLQSLLPRIERDLTYHLNPKLAPYFAVSSFTLIDWQKRQMLKQQDLARWLHLWIASNAKYYPTKVETIREKCGSQTKSLRHFREKLRAALMGLQESEIIGDWEIEKGSDILYLQTKPSASQKKHLIRARPRRRR